MLNPRPHIPDQATRTLVHELGRMYGDQRLSDDVDKNIFELKGENGNVRIWDLIIDAVYANRHRIEFHCKCNGNN